MIAFFILIIYCALFLSKEKSFIYIYNLGVIMFGVFICAKWDSFSTSLIYHIVPLAMFMTIIPFLKKYLSFIVKAFAILLSYILIKAIFWHVDIIRMFMDLRLSIFAICMGLSMIEYIRNKQFSVRLFLKGFYILISIQLLLGIAQYLIPSISNFFIVVDTDATRDADVLSQYLNMSLVTGTMTTPSVLAGLLAMSFFVLFSYEDKNNTITFGKVLFGLVLLAVLFITGIRTPFIMLVIFIGIYLFCYRRKLFLCLSPLFIAGIVIIFSTNIVDYEGSIGRMFQGFTQISEGMEGLSESTFRFTIFLIPFFLQDPIFGFSQYDTVAAKLFFDGFSKSDVYLLYILCQYGLVGLSLFLIPFFKMKMLSYKEPKLSFLRINYSTIIYFVSLGLCLSIVDEGIFHFTEVGMVVMAIVLFSVDEKNVMDSMLKKK